jgi:hypothetical protein
MNENLDFLKIFLRISKFFTEWLVLAQILLAFGDSINALLFGSSFGDSLV